MDKDKSGRAPAILLSKDSQGKGANKSLLKNNTGNKNEIKKGCLLVDYIPRLKFKKTPPQLCHCREEPPPSHRRGNPSPELIFCHFGVSLRLNNRKIPFLSCHLTSWKEDNDFFLFGPPDILEIHNQG